MRFNSQKLQEDLRTKRIIKEGMNVNAASRDSNVPKYQYTRAEKYGGMDIEVFTKLVAWLGTNPDEYFTDLKRPQLSDFEYEDITRGLIIAMKTLDDLGIDQKLSDRLEVIDMKIRPQ